MLCAPLSFPRQTDCLCVTAKNFFLVLCFRIFIKTEGEPIAASTAAVGAASEQTKMAQQCNERKEHDDDVRLVCELHKM